VQAFAISFGAGSGADQLLPRVGVSRSPRLDREPCDGLLTVANFQ
jgi:hypothetical protein